MTVNWLNTMRNSFAGFSSTQDTITAMEALYAYTLKDTNRNEFDMTVTLEATSTPNWQRVGRLLKEDFTHLHRSYLPNEGVYGYIIPTAQGVGRAMLQLTVTSNVEYKHLMKTQQRYDNLPESDPIPFFDLTVEPLWGGRNDSIMRMHACVSWLYTTRSLTSGLAVLEVETPTGYVVMNDTLRDYVRSRAVRNLRRAEFYGNKVVFYFDYLDESSTCVDFRADRWYPVANMSRDHRMRVYDYYEPGMHNTTLYTVENLFRMSVCFVCGSYQCPYCPNFNTAAILGAGTPWNLLPIMVLMLLSLLLQHR
ncbi:unnamed protein product [Candidula unifasciata]|uniref:Alpha-macroglobulin receptor-binding domain-containing protein n=1 Tax=Candidula unifasciata TaxID=100452 RepID=A0A8S3ZCZ6_9EUPU|nr:unnamed protein product [Candidula unifasciata]